MFSPLDALPIVLHYLYEEIHFFSEETPEREKKHSPNVKILAVVISLY
jgi:hypothetical protein